MTSLDELLKKEQGKLNTFDNEETDYPAKHLKHDMLYLSKDTPEQLVRILPPVTDEANLGEGYREFWVEGSNASGKEVRTKLVLDANPNPNNKLDQQINTWVEAKNIPNKFGSRPSKRFMLNTVRLSKNQEGKFVHEVDEQGELVVRVLQVPQSLYTEALTKLSNVYFEPAGVTDGYRIISEQNAYPFDLKRSGTGLDTRYTVDVYERDLGPLPNNWRDKSEDLAYQASKTDEDDSYANYVIAVVNGQEAEYNATRNNGGSDSGVDDPNPVNINPNDLPGNLRGGGQPNQQNQPQGQFSQPQGQPEQQQPNFNTGSGEGQFAQPTSQPSAQPTQPTQPTQPVQQQPSQQEQPSDNGAPLNTNVDTAIENDLDSFMNNLPEFGE